MCGLIVARSEEAVTRGLERLHHRGPDAHSIVQVGEWWLGHTRLSILDLSSAADQPFTSGPVTVVYNGELWNWEALRATLSGPWATSGDTEVIAAHLAAGRPLDALDGQFAVCWTDGETMRVARDRLGEVPLHEGWADGQPVIASELKALEAAGCHMPGVRWVMPGTTITYEGKTREARSWANICGGHTDTTIDLTEASERLDVLLADAVAKRTTVADVPVAALTSGGIDSSAVAWHMLNHQPLVAYTAVFDSRSKDLRHARETCDALGVELREVTVEAPDADDLARMVELIEIPHKAQVEIAWLCWALAQRIRADGFKVVLTGEGADELFASYGNAYHGIKQKGWHGYRRDAVATQHRKNWARVNKIFMAASVEGRLPFADQDLVRYGLSLPRTAVEEPGQVKWALRARYLDRLPVGVVRRPKAAFQTEARLPDTIRAQIADPSRYYRAIHRQTFKGAKP